MTRTHTSKLWHPFQAVPLGKAFAPSLILTVLLMVVLFLVDRPLKSAVAPNGIISFEFAGSVNRAQEIVQSWEGTPAPFAGFSLGIDYLYMVAYSIAIALACIWASRMVENMWWPLASLGVLLAWGQGLAAALDAVENVALVIELLVRVAAPLPQVAWAAAAVKFALIVAGLLYSAFGVVAWLAGRAKQVQLAQ